MTEDEAARAARDSRTLGAPGVLLLVISIVLLYLGGLTLLGTAMVPAMGPEDEVPVVTWAVPLCVGLGGVPAALVRKATVTRLTLLAIGCAMAGPSLLLLARHASGGQTTVDDALLVVPLGVGTLAMLVAERNRRVTKADALSRSSP